MFHSLEQIGDCLGPASERPESEGLKRAPAPSPDTSCCHTNRCVYALSDTTCSNPSDTSSKPFGRARAAATSVSGGSYAATASQYRMRHGFERIASKLTPTPWAMRRPDATNHLPHFTICRRLFPLWSWPAVVGPRPQLFPLVSRLMLPHAAQTPSTAMAYRSRRATPEISPVQATFIALRSLFALRLGICRVGSPAGQHPSRGLAHLPQPVCHAPASASSRAGRCSGACQ